MDRARRRLPFLLAAAVAGGCTGQIEAPAGRAGAPGAPPAAGVIDVGTVAIHRLNNLEYDNTVHDLLGVTGTAAASFIPDEKALGFDTIADAFTMSDARYEQYFDAADALVERVFADAALRARLVTCAPAAADDAACTRQIVSAFGLRAWRRPLADGEVASLVALGADARALGEDWTGALKQVVKTMLVAPQFLYRIELDPDPASRQPHPLGGYELASRLSYLLWGTMPDDRLFGLAASGALADDAMLATEVDRMLADARGASFASSFAGQWLGLRDLASHQVEPTAFPAWNEPLRAAMIADGLAYFAGFLTGPRAMSEFLTAELPAGAAGAGGERQGFLGLPAFLTVSSFSYRTAPTLRGKWVLENLLCGSIPPPPAGVPELDDGAAGSAATQSLNVRARLAEHRANPMCAACHTLLDPIGLGLESFDAVGQYRARYANGDAIDASGVMPDGARFNGLKELSVLLAGDARFLDCASRKLMTYTLSRALGAADEPALQQVRERWSRQGHSLRALVKLLVQSPPFRYRHG